MELQDMLGKAVAEAKKHPELLDQVVGFVKGRVGGKDESSTEKRSPAKKGSTPAKAGAKTAAKKGTGAAEPKEGLAGLLGDLDLAGLAEQASSWVGTGPNERVSGAKVKKALGNERVAAAAKKAGISEDEAASGIAQLLPAVVDYLTPDGKVPSPSKTAKRLGDLEKAER
ncbi:MAG TPA: YidB family protein [Actinomycetota bacterium]|nr:YidB family protein [Actinomycetota bacterium]